jgi:hypothetical protein
MAYLEVLPMGFSTIKQGVCTTRIDLLSSGICPFTRWFYDMAWRQHAKSAAIVLLIPGFRGVDDAPREEAVSM